MESKYTLTLVLSSVLFIASTYVHCEYGFTEISPSSFQLRPKVTHLHFYYFDIHTGPKATAVVVARPNHTNSLSSSSSPSPSSFGTLYAIDNVLRTSNEESSKVIGNARCSYVVATINTRELTLVMSVDYAFTEGKYIGSSFSIMSRNLVTEPIRELAVVGGRGKFRMATGYALIKAHFLNLTTGDGIIAYNVTLFHY